MTEHELATQLREWCRAEAADGPSASLRPAIVAIPDVIEAPRPGAFGGSGAIGNRRGLALLAAMLAMAVVVGGTVAIGSGLVRLPWEETPPIQPAAIDPCAVVAGGPSIRQENNLLPDPSQTSDDFEEEANRRSPARLNSFEGSGCLFLRTDHRNSLSQFQLRDQVTTTEDAAEVAAQLFRTGRQPFSAGPIRTQVSGHPAWVGQLVSPGQGADDPYRVGMAVSAAPYFFVLVLDVGVGVQLSDGAGEIWWENHVAPQARPLAAQLMTKLEQLGDGGSD